MLSTQSEGTLLTHAEPAHHLVRLLGLCGHAVRNSIQPPMTHLRSCGKKTLCNATGACRLVDRKLCNA